MSRRSRIITLTLPLVEMASNLYARYCAVAPQDRNAVARVLKFKGDDELIHFIRRAIKVGTDGFKGDTSEAEQMYQLTVKLNTKLGELGYDAPIARSNPDKDHFSFMQLMPVIEGMEPDDVEDEEIQKWYRKHTVRSGHYGLHNRVAEQLLPEVKALETSVKSLSFFRDKAVKAQTQQEMTIAAAAWTWYKSKLEQYGEPDDTFKALWHQHVEHVLTTSKLERQRLYDILFWEFHNHQDMRDLNKQCWGIWNLPSTTGEKIAPELLVIAQRKPKETQQIERRLVGLQYNVQLPLEVIRSWSCPVRVERWYETKNGEQLARDIVLWQGELPPFIKQSDKYPAGMIALVAFGEPETQPGIYHLTLKEFSSKTVIASLARHTVA